MIEKKFIDEILSVEEELALLIENMIADEMKPKLIKNAVHLHKRIYGAISSRVYDDVHIGEMTKGTEKKL